MKISIGQIAATLTALFLASGIVQAETVKIATVKSTTLGAIYTPVSERLLPLDAAWRRGLMQRHWPTHLLPEVLGTATTTLRALIGEYLFVSLFRACAESLASENASRLAAMQRAEKNIDQLLLDMNASFHRLRQRSIDEELFDVVSGFEAVSQ